MKNNHDEPILKRLTAWSVETTDITSRVMSAIGAPAVAEELLAELRAVRQELADIRRGNALLQDEMARLTHELAARTATRITPYAPTEGLIRLA